MNGTAAGLFDELERGVVRPVYLLLGEDQGAKEEFLARLRSVHFRGKCADSGREDVTVFHGDEADVGDILQALATLSFFSGKKLVVVRGCDKLSGSKLLAEHAEKMAAASPKESGGAPREVLALLSDKKNADKTLEKAVEKNGRSCVFWPMFENEGERWVLRKLKERGIKTDAETLKYIVDVTGTTVDDLTNQVEAISNLVDRGGGLDIETAKRALSRIYSCTVFDLTASLFVKKPAEILSIFRRLLANGEDLLKISYFVGREVRKVLDACALKESGNTFGQAARILGLKKMETARIGNIVERVGVPFLRSLYAGLSNLDYLIKTSPRGLCLVHFERLLLGLGRKGDR